MEVVRKVVATVTMPDLPVAWWLFWLTVVAAGGAVGLAWWLTREALREDAAEVGHDDREDGGRPADAAPPEDEFPPEDASLSDRGTARS